MFGDMRYKSIIATSLIVMLLSKWAFGTIEGNTELLKLVANGYKANMSKLVTWQGKANITYEGGRFDSTSNEWEKHLIRKSSTEFLHDVEQNSLRWYWYKLLGRSEIKGERPITEKPYFTSGIAVGRRRYTRFPSPMTKDKEPSPANVSIIPISRKEINEINGWEDEFHPMFYFKSIHHDWNERLMFYYDNAKDPNISNGRVWKKGNVVLFETISKVPPIVITQYAYDLSKGCCITQYSRKADYTPAQVVWKFDYENVNGVFVPKIADCHRIQRDGLRRSNRHIEFVQNIINRPIPAEEFDIVKLPLVAGDKIQDHATGQKWVYPAHNNGMQSDPRTSGR